MVQMHSNNPQQPMDIAAILKNRAQGHRDSTYAMLLQLVAADRLPECLDALQRMVTTPRVGCWRDVRGFILHFEEHGEPHKAATADIIRGCVRMTNARIRLDCFCAGPSWAAKWVPREPKCRGSLLLQWYYDALADDMFPGAPDAKRRYRKLIVQLTPPPETEAPGLAQLVKRALNLNATSHSHDHHHNHLNAMWRVFKQKHQPQQPLVPALSLAHSMGAGHNNCLHAGIGLALLLSPHGRMITFSSHAQWHQMKDPDDFVSNAQHLFQTARSPTNGLNANLGDVLKLAPNEPLLVISDMEHDPSDDLGDDGTGSSHPMNKIAFWNVSYNGLPSSLLSNECQMNHTDDVVIIPNKHYF
jgi:hypothetical protein